MKITYALCEFIGAVIGDGNLWTDGSRYRIELTGDPNLDWTYYEYLSQIAFKLFGKKPYHLRKRQKGIRFRLQSKYAFQIFRELGMPIGEGKSLSVEIPRLIIEKGWDYSKWTIRGIMDTDGTLFFSKKTYKQPIYPTLEIRTHSIRLASQITEILRQNGFRARPRGNKKRGYHVALYGKEMLEKWIEEIGFSNKRHFDKLLKHKIYMNK